ncbi:MAG: hypothetical protein EOP61_09440, partial [Sphingomonadales bacterium]
MECNIMYADQRYITRTPRSVSLGGSLAFSGLLIAGLMSFVPSVITGARPEAIKLVDFKDPVPPPPEPAPKPETKPQASQPELYIPQPPIPQPQQPVMAGTQVMP